MALGCVCVALCSVLLALFLIPSDWSSELMASRSAPVRLLTKQELRGYSGERGGPGLYLSILGQVFDVHSGDRHYGPGGAYHGMAGKDASLAFVTGDFTPAGLTDDVSALSPSQVLVLYDWLAFYQKDYKPVGRLIGRFYSERGRPTAALMQLESRRSEGLRLKAQVQAEREQFPACNSEWSAALGGRVWCSTKSGGIDRVWTGVPRKLYSPGSGRSRCVCVEDPTAAENPNMQEYQGCSPRAASCPLGGEEVG